jgi:hypothetical protein
MTMNDQSTVNQVRRGEVTMESEVGKGSCFSLGLALIQAKMQRQMIIHPLKLISIHSLCGERK